MQGVDRTRRIGQLLRKELAVIIAKEVDSGALGLVSITAVSVSKDLRHARVYVTALAAKVSQAEVADQLNAQAATLRWALGQRAELRRTPELVFEYDASIERGTEMSKLLDDIEIPEGESGGN
jgi:ribosome-binding factor A